ncbi:MAG TPA: diguanylate cyclase [Spirochaetota bacterium]|nr:diguanylate cyclase [Spirochaetota bacterium]HQF08958.1 diguanylate cyclase [Spirochaetota bacterium]HQH98766.1 diguanylate cyclase [Spirochaetota bacterium]HQJ72241.1 diguanylate cyclase [Spirochaetota bacterium]
MNVLLVNSNQSFKSAVSSSLKGYKPKLVVSEGIDNVLADIQKNNIQVAIINWASGDFDIESLCRRIRKIKSNRFYYLLVVTTREREGAIEKFLQAGANDFIFKPFGKEEILSRMKIAERIIKLEEEMQRNKKKMLTLVKEDPVTGLFNRRSLLDEVLKEMGRASREMKYISAMVTSITNFKELIELHGIAVMDEVLVECGRRMKVSCRPYDKIGRYTVSDFLIFLPGSGKHNAEKVAKRIIAAFAKKPLVINDSRMQISLSIGVAELDPKQIAKNNSVDSNLLNDLVLDALIKKSELAVKRAIRMGNNKIEVFMD